MRSTLFGFGVVYIVGAALLVLDISGMPTMTIKNLAVLAFLLPGVVATVGGLEMARLQRQLRELRSKGRE